MSIEARQIQETLYSYTAILNFTHLPQGLRAKFDACSVQNAQLFLAHSRTQNLAHTQGSGNSRLSASSDWRITAT